MPKKVITKEIENFIRKNYLKMSGQAIAERFGIDKGIVYRFMKREGLKANRAQVRKWAAEKRRKPMTKKEGNFIHRNIETMSIKSISKELRRTSSYVSKWVHELGYSELVEQRILDSRIKKGHVSPWKGKTWDELGIPKETRKRMLRTAFKPGNEPANTLSDGDITVRLEHPDRNGGRLCKYIRVAKGIWETLHRHNWEKINGPIPEGMLVAFVDGDSMNCEPDSVENLELITQRENMLRNSIFNYPEDIKKNIMLTNKLQRKINEYEQHHGTQ